MMWPPAASPQLAHASALPSGDQVGWNCPTSAGSTRLGVPLGSSARYSRSSAVKATRFPSGETTGLRICRAVTIAEVSTR